MSTVESDYNRNRNQMKCTFFRILGFTRVIHNLRKGLTAWAPVHDV